MNKNLSKSGLFLIELMVAVLFFALCACVCLSIFVKAHLMSVESSDITNALNAAQMAAECVKTNRSDMAVLLGGEEISEDQYLVLYDENWDLTEEPSEMKYEMRIFVNDDTPLWSAMIEIQKSGRSIYEVEVKKYNG